MYDLDGMRNSEWVLKRFIVFAFCKPLYTRRVYALTINGKEYDVCY